MLLYEFKHGLDAYLAASGAPVRSLAELIEYNKAHADAASGTTKLGALLREQLNSKGE